MEAALLWIKLLRLNPLRQPAVQPMMRSRKWVFLWNKEGKGPIRREELYGSQLDDGLSDRG
jgi:hypothetical protein